MLHYLPLCYHVLLPMMFTFLVVRTRQGGAGGICARWDCLALPFNCWREGWNSVSLWVVWGSHTACKIRGPFSQSIPTSGRAGICTWHPDQEGARLQTICTYSAIPHCDTPMWVGPWWPLSWVSKRVVIGMPGRIANLGHISARPLHETRKKIVLKGALH